MSYQEKTIWLGLPIDLALLLGYSGWLLVQLQSTSAEAIDYKWVLIWVLIAGVVLSIISQIILAVILHKQANLEDVRDKEIRLRANSATLYFISIPFFLAIVFALQDVSNFQLVHLLYLGGSIANVLNSAVRLHYYRRGL